MNTDEVDKQKKKRDKEYTFVHSLKSITQTLYMYTIILLGHLSTALI